MRLIAVRLGLLSASILTDMRAQGMVLVILINPSDRQLA